MNEEIKNCQAGNKEKYLWGLDERLNDIMFLVDKALYLANEMNEKVEFIGYAPCDHNEQVLNKAKENLGIHADILVDYIEKIGEALKKLEENVHGDFVKEKKRLEERIVKPETKEEIKNCAD